MVYVPSAASIAIGGGPPPSLPQLAGISEVMLCTQRCTLVQPCVFAGPRRQEGGRIELGGGCTGKRDATMARRHEECRHHAQLPPLASADSADICSSAGQKSAVLSAQRWRELWQDYAAFLTALERIRCLCSAVLCFGTGLLASHFLKNREPAIVHGALCGACL